MIYNCGEDEWALMVSYDPTTNSGTSVAITQVKNTKQGTKWNWSGRSNETLVVNPKLFCWLFNFKQIKENEK